MRNGLRIIFGLFLVLMGANKFFGLLPPPELSAQAGQFMGALVETGYMLPMIGFTEILCGALVLFSATAPLGVLLFAPVAINIVAFHLFLDLSSGFMGAFVFLLNLALGIMYFDYYRPIFAKILTEKVEIRGKKAPATHKTVATVN